MIRRIALAATAALLLAVPSFAADPQSLTDGLARRVEQHGDRVLDILIVSGSGQAGAFGAGFLRGWEGRQGADALPQFDLTLGTGTGGVLAAFAYDGRPDAIADAGALYAGYVSHFAAVPDHLKLMRRTKHRVRRGGVDTVIDRAVLGRGPAIRIATDRDDRQLVIATTDLMSGRRNYWDIGRELIVDGGEDQVRQVLQASTLQPNQDRPTYVDGRAQVTGTVDGNLPFGMGLADFEALGRRLRADGRGPIKIRLWAMVDLWTDPVRTGIHAGHERQVENRVTGLADLARTRAELVRLVELSHAVSAAVPGVTMETRWVAVPQDQARDVIQKQPFDKQWPQRLETLGYSAAVSATPWRTDAPRDVPLP